MMTELGPRELHLDAQRQGQAMDMPPLALSSKAHYSPQPDLKKKTNQKKACGDALRREGKGDLLKTSQGKETL